MGLKGEKKDMALRIRETERQAGLGLVGAGGSRGPHVVCEHQELNDLNAWRCGGPCPPAASLVQISSLLIWTSSFIVVFTRG